MSDANPQFDDPALKLALRRAIPAIAAPQALRARVQQAVADLASDQSLRLPSVMPASPRSAFRLFRAHRLAIAASILGLAGGVAVFQFAGDGARQAVVSSDVSDLQPVAYSLASQHAGMAGDPIQVQHHAQAMSVDNLSAASQSLQRQTGESLPLSPFAAAGWQFHGADDCRLDHWQGTHLAFRRPNQTLSVFILPAQAAGNIASGKLYAMTTGRNPVAGAVCGRWFICLIGASTDGSLKGDDLSRLLQQILPSR